jgi:hypothetical protein
MSDEPGGDLAVDVLVIGSGLQGLYVARALQHRYSVCVVSDPSIPSDTLEWSGHISAGYEGNDVARMQPARRAAGYWRLWAESNAVPHDYSPAYVVLPEPAGEAASRRWDDASLSYESAPIPEMLEGGSLDGEASFRVDNDLVLNPAVALSQLHTGLEAMCIEGRVTRFGLVGDRVIDHVQVETGGRTLPVVPGFVISAAGVGNAAVLDQIARRFADQSARLEHRETVRRCQAVQREPIVCIRGALPLIAGWFGELSIVAHPLRGTDEQGGDEVVWVVAGMPDPEQTVLGLDDTRFEPAVGPEVIAHMVTQLFDLSPKIDYSADSLHWGTYVGRRVQHPSVAGPDADRLATPVPAKLESFGLDGFLALWPSHPGYSMILGDVVAERVTDALDEPMPVDRMFEPGGGRPMRTLLARWERPEFEWASWSSFAAHHGVD